MITFSDLPPNTYLNFSRNKNGKFVKSPQLLREINNKFIKTAPDLKATTTKIGIPRALPYRIKNGSKTKIRKEYLQKICDYLVENGYTEYALGNPEHMLYSITTPHGEELKICTNTERTFPFNLE